MAQPQQTQSQPQQAGGAQSQQAGAASSQQQQQQQQQGTEPKLLWNPENIRDVAESVGISSLNEDAQRVLTQDVEYRIGQVIVEALRFMRACRRTTLTVGDVAQALKVLDVEPLYGYDSTRPLRYGEASLGPGQPLFYLEDEEIDFEKLVNAPLPKVPRDMSFTAHWLAIEGVQPSIPQNPTTAESRNQDLLLPKGPGANPAAAALAGNDNLSFRPAVKHVISKELTLYFEKVQSALLDDNPDEEVIRLRHAALNSARSDPGLHQLIPYFVNFISNQVTQRLDDVFSLRRAMELTEALTQNESLFLDPYANSMAASVLTCLLGRKLGGNDEEALKDHYQLREFSASLLGKIATRYAPSNHLLRPKLVRTCLKQFMDPDRGPATHYGAIIGLAAAGGPEAVRVLVLKFLRPYNDEILQRLKDKGDSNTLDYEMLVGGIIKAILTIVEDDKGAITGVDGGASDAQAAELNEFVGPIVGERLAQIGNRRLIEEVLDAKNIQ